MRGRAKIFARQESIVIIFENNCNPKQLRFVLLSPLRELIATTKASISLPYLVVNALLFDYTTTTKKKKKKIT